MFDKEFLLQTAKVPAGHPLLAASVSQLIPDVIRSRVHQRANEGAPHHAE